MVSAVMTVQGIVAMVLRTVISIIMITTGAMWTVVLPGDTAAFRTPGTLLAHMVTAVLLHACIMRVREVSHA